MKRILLALVAAVALAACATPKYVTSDVTRFHTLPNAPSGQTFVIATTNPEQGQSLAFRKYADDITAKLTGLGLRAAAGGNASADYVVTMNYDVRGPTPDVESRNWGGGFGMGFAGRGGWGGGWGGWGGGPWGYGAWGDPGWQNRTDTRQLFVRSVEIDIYRGASYDTPKKDRVFEGRALSLGQNGQLETVLPYILDALFKDFPGRSGETLRVSIEVPPNVDAAASTKAPSARSSY